MDAQEKILRYIMANHNTYNRMAIDAELQEKGFTTEQIREAWEIIEQENKSQATPTIPDRPGWSEQWPFWLTLILFVPGVPFISGLIDGIFNRSAGGGYSPISFWVGVPALLIAFFAGIWLIIRNREIWERAVGVALIVALVLTIALLFIPPFILNGVCIAGVRLGGG